MTVLILSALPALFSVWLLADFILWRLRGEVVLATIAGFQEKTSRGLRLPVVRIETPDGPGREVAASRIDRLLYLFNRPQEGDAVAVIYRADDPGRARVYGYINVLAALFLLVPFMATLALQAGNSVALTQTLYMLTFGAIILGGWVFLKLIQRFY